MKRADVIQVLILIDAEIGAAEGDEPRQRAAMTAHRAASKLHVDDVDVSRMRRFNGSVGAFGYWSASGATPASRHPDRCVCQGNESTPHKHYDDAPHDCARCNDCPNGYVAAQAPPTPPLPATTTTKGER